jgi:hypothetical protein
MEPNTEERVPPVNTSYGLRVPVRSEVIAAFGTAKRALRATGGDIAAVCFCIANQSRIPPEDAQSATICDDGMARLLRDWIDDEREEEICDAWRKQQGRKTVAAVMRECACSFDYAARVLAAAGLRP